MAEFILNICFTLLAGCVIALGVTAALSFSNNRTYKFREWFTGYCRKYDEKNDTLVLWRKDDIIGSYGRMWWHFWRRPESLIIDQTKYEEIVAGDKYEKSKWLTWESMI